LQIPNNEILHCVQIDKNHEAPDFWTIAGEIFWEAGLENVNRKFIQA
jgi:hypothetical protein